MEALEATFEGGAAKIEVSQGTTALTPEGTPLEAIQVQPVEEPPAPTGAHIIALAYDFGPDGVTFAPPVTITLEYDPALLPEGVAEEDLVIAYFNVETGEWVELDCVVDPATHTVTGQASHFTLFAILGKAGAAAFSPSNLAITPAEAFTGEAVTISVDVQNTGEVEGSYTATLKVNGVAEETEEVTLAAGASITMSFAVSKDTPGSYEVEVDGLSVSFIVTTPPETLRPPAFTVTDLTISPATAGPGESVTISAQVTNTGGVEGTYTASLKIGGEVEDTQVVSLRPGSSQMVVFTVTKDDPGKYSVRMGALAGQFDVEGAGVAISWGITLSIVLGAAAAGLAVFLLVRRERRKPLGRPG